MVIKHKFEFVEGDFETASGKLRCVPNKKYMRVDLCFDEGYNIPFAKIQLHTHDRFVDAEEVFDSATKLGEEICKRWNAYPDLQQKIDDLNIKS